MVQRKVKPVRDSLPESKNLDNFDNPCRKGEVSADHSGTLLLEQGLTLSILEIRNLSFTRMRQPMYLSSCYRCRYIWLKSGDISFELTNELLPLFSECEVFDQMYVWHRGSSNIIFRAPNDDSPERFRTLTMSTSSKTKFFDSMIIMESKQFPSNLTW